MVPITEQVASYHTCMVMRYHICDGDNSQYAYDHYSVPNLRQLHRQHHEQEKLLAGFRYVPEPNLMPAYTLAELISFFKFHPGTFSLVFHPELENYKFESIYHHERENTTIEIHQCSDNPAEAVALLIHDLTSQNLLKQ